MIRPIPAKIESGKVEIKYEPIGVCQAVIEEVVAALKPLAEKKGLDYTVNAPKKAACGLNLITAFLSQILINLANNAISKFTDQGLHRIELELLECLTGTGTLASIEVIDIESTAFALKTKKNCSRHFNRWTTIIWVKALGLGLYSARKLAFLIGVTHRAGQRIWQRQCISTADSAGLVWSAATCRHYGMQPTLDRFRVWLGTNRGGLKAATGHTSEFRSMKWHVYWSLRTSASLDLMVYLLKAFGHTPLSARDGLEGGEVARREVPDLILCDIQLPGADGVESFAVNSSWARTCKEIPLVADHCLCDGRRSRKAAGSSRLRWLSGQADKSEHYPADMAPYLRTTRTS